MFELYAYRGLYSYSLIYWCTNKDINLFLAEFRHLLKAAKLELKKSKRKDYYKILGVPKTATDDELKKGYRKEALKHHPGEVVFVLYVSVTWPLIFDFTPVLLTSNIWPPLIYGLTPLAPRDVWYLWQSIIKWRCFDCGDLNYSSFKRFEFKRLKRQCKSTTVKIA